MEVEGDQEDMLGRKVGVDVKEDKLVWCGPKESNTE